MPRITPERRAARRQQILEAAWECFAREGFQATTMDQVAATAGVSAGMAYTYFATKDDLIIATSEAALGRFAEAFERLSEELTEPASPSEILAVIGAELRRRAEHPRYDMNRIALQAWAEAVRNPAVHAALREGQARIAATMRRVVERWTRTCPDPPDPESTSELLRLLVPGLILGTVLSGQTPTVELDRAVSGPPPEATL